MTQSKPKQFVSVQYLRALAAIIVILHHARNPRPWLFNPVPDLGIGQAGVDIFFIISGFIMYESARGEAPAEFVRRRIVRVVPLYWIATLLTLLVAAGSPLTWDGRILGDLVQSLLFIPHYNLEHPDRIWPVLIPGWTLNFEMFFYLLFAIAIATRRLLVSISATLCALVAAGLAFRFENPILLTYTDPLIAEFLMGILLARYREKLAHPPAMLLLPVGIAALAASAAVMGPRVLSWGLPAFAIVAGALAVEANHRLPRVPLLSHLGDASYSIYLFQIIVVAGMGRVLRLLPLTGPVQFAAMVLGSLGGAIVIGLIAHHAIERPLHRVLNRRRRRPVPESASPHVAPVSLTAR